ncbi:replication protein P [Photobacterium damselae]|uniref:replication protein P n=1 Tax=Photobacterium damselae TaxID=38293 RepID=UPI0013A5ABB6|nr:replication protein P [Photobacterium damselae]
MKNLVELTENVVVSIERQPRYITQCSKHIDEFAMQNINAIFKDLCAIFPAWRNHLRTSEEFRATRTNFAKGMMENGITSMDQVRRGLTRARQQESDFFPSVGKFISWCRDLDDWEEAFKRMLSNEPALSLPEKFTRNELSWPIRHHLSEYDALFKFKTLFHKYQSIERDGGLHDLPQLPYRCVITDIDIKRNSVVVSSKSFRKGSVFARIAARGESNHG